MSNLVEITPLYKIFFEAKLGRSGNDIKKLIEGGGAYVNNIKIQSKDAFLAKNDREQYYICDFREEGIFTIPALEKSSINMRILYNTKGMYQEMNDKPEIAKEFGVFILRKGSKHVKMIEATFYG